MRNWVVTGVLLGAMVAQGSLPAAARGLEGRVAPQLQTLMPMRSSGLSVQTLPIRIALDAVKSGSMPAATDVPPAPSDGAVPAVVLPTDGATPSPDGSAADANATPDASAVPAKPAANVYKPPSVEQTPAGVTIYRGSGTP